MELDSDIISFKNEVSLSSGSLSRSPSFSLTASNLHHDHHHGLFSEENREVWFEDLLGEF